MKYEIELDLVSDLWAVRVVQVLPRADSQTPPEVRTVFETTHKYSLHTAREQAMLALGRAEKQRKGRTQ